jgi:hypothetical protein
MIMILLLAPATDGGLLSLMAGSADINRILSTRLEQRVVSFVIRQWTLQAGDARIFMHGADCF